MYNVPLYITKIALSVGHCVMYSYFRICHMACIKKQNMFIEFVNKAVNFMYFYKGKNVHIMKCFPQFELHFT